MILLLAAAISLLIPGAVAQPSPEETYAPTHNVTVRPPYMIHNPTPTPPPPPPTPSELCRPPPYTPPPPKPPMVRHTPIIRRPPPPVTVNVTLTRRTVPPIITTPLPPPCPTNESIPVQIEELPPTTEPLDVEESAAPAQSCSGGFGCIGVAGAYLARRRLRKDNKQY